MRLPLRLWLHDLGPGAPGRDLQEGDDADLISKKGGGILISVSDPKPEKKLSQLKSILLSRSCGYYSKLAHDHRNPSVLKLATEFVLQKWVTINRLAD